MEPAQSRDSATNVLIAEDDDDDFYIFSVAIEETSFTVILSRAENGEILLELLEKNLPDILFLDLLMLRQPSINCWQTFSPQFDPIFNISNGDVHTLSCCWS